MDIKELTDLLVISSQRTNQSKYIPWWEDDFENCIYRYDIFEDETVQDINALVKDCGKDALLAPVGYYGLTLFHLLVWHNFYDAVKDLLDSGTFGKDEVNLPDLKGHGLTPFLLAVFRGNLAMTRLLLDHGADDSLCDERGMNAYHFLEYPRFEGLVNFRIDESMEQRTEIARLLTCDINQKNQEGLTPLEQMLSLSHSSNFSWALTEIFLEKGATTDYIDENGNTLLMMALRNNHMTAALMLMDRYSDMVNTANKDGITPIQHALDWRNDGIYLALVDHGAVPPEPKHMDISYLSQITSNSFCMSSGEERDGISIALYLTRKLISQIDVDDDDELGEITNILHNALISDKDYQVLDACKEAGLDFTAPIHFHGSIFCLRDKCLGAGYGMGAIQKMLELGVDMDKAVIQGQTPANIIAAMDRQTGYYSKYESYFDDAAKIFSVESMEQLDNNGEAAIHKAAQYGHAGMLKIMLEKGVDVNLTEDAPAEPGITALHEACRNGYANIVKILMDAGADDSMTNMDGETPAHFAVKKKRYGNDIENSQRAEILKELKNLDLAREDGKTPLLLLQVMDIYSTSELHAIFLERGVDVNHTDNNGMTAMMLNADNRCCKDTLKALLRSGADINLADNDGNTLLHYTLRYGNAETARFLIKKGADYNCANNRGETPVQLAVEKGHDTVLELMTDIK